MVCDNISVEVGWKKVYIMVLIHINNLNETLSSNSVNELMSVFIFFLRNRTIGKAEKKTRNSKILVFSIKKLLTRKKINDTI